MEIVKEKMDEMNSQLIECRACPRLVEWREHVSQVKVKRFRDEVYWGKPVPGFGDAEARLVIVGLAPAAHGANRTGRMFTGDSSGDWLYRALYEAGFANQPDSNRADDGLQLYDTWITSPVKCAPPKNKPVAEEILHCDSWFQQELKILDQAEVYLCLGRIGFDRLSRSLGSRKLDFGHNRWHEIGGNKKIVASYHPSRQNTNTGKLKWDAWLKVFTEIRDFLYQNH